MKENITKMVGYGPIHHPLIMMDGPLGSLLMVVITKIVQLLVLDHIDGMMHLVQTLIIFYVMHTKLIQPNHQASIRLHCLLNHH